MNYGLFISLFGSFLFGLEPVIIKYLQTSGYKSPFLVFWLFLISLLVYIIMAAKNHAKLPPVRTICRMMAIGSVGMGLTTLLLTLSYDYIQTSTATMIHFSYPILVVICMAVIFHQRFTRYKLIACLCSFIGMICITNFTFGGMLPGYLLAFASAICYSFYDIINEKGSFTGLPSYTKMTFLSLGVVLFFGLICLFLRIPILPKTMLDAGLILAIGLMNCFGYICIMIGISKIGASKTAFAATMEPVTSVLLSILVYKDSFSGFSLLGLILIFVSVFAIMKN